MPKSFTPYTYIQCPCSDTGSSAATAAREAKSAPSFADTSSHIDRQPSEHEGDDRTFDPRSARANYSLYPLEYLLYCEDCHQIRCPRCVAEEIVTYYCPSCLFEVPTSNLKSEGNRCTRSCFQCPICVAPLTVTSLEAAPVVGSLGVPEGGSAGSGGPFVLTCSYCQWCSTEVGIKFDKANGLYSQLAKLRNGGKARLLPRERKERPRQLSVSMPSLLVDGEEPQALSVGLSSSAAATEAGHEQGLDIDRQFGNLKQFYQQQLSETSGTGAGGLASFGDLGFGSQASLSRIMSMYTSGLALSGSRFDKRAQSRVRTMREARDEAEGFLVAQLDESAVIDRLCGLDGAGSDSSHDAWDATASAEQRAAQPTYTGEAQLHGRARFLDELRPVPVLLRTKRSKRCPVCRHIISKPEAKSTNNRFRIRLVAGSYIPSISIRPLQTSGSVSSIHVSSPSTSSSARTASASMSTSTLPTNLLEPLKPVQYILTFKNPIFENVRVTLAAPSTTPGRFASKVTVLCPQFEVDSNTDVWDDALRDNDRGPSSGSGGSAVGSSGHGRRTDDSQPHQAMAGKIWERGRNWVSIVLEVVPPSLSLEVLAVTSRSAANKGKEVDLGPLREDEDVVEIPMFVRVEWEAEVEKDGGGTTAGRDKDAKEKRELAYWCVLGIGRVRRD
ncbi:dynactin arp1 p62 subunit [Grosmannia clavigera kw1407]|uniref:Dynactin subunit 4 n=1 Tax=Grosmannia clavigera (strain kw1407 / UAMH 11150) TaxID=655863 RepID=F0XJS5_GROCL|nr:dynactin arp1 p62 subunit [Grosmannia clavigera kw1407]EFX02446.1 dynactin arp1 p62 subunit [Grosmannia clavigera kw1407]